MPLRGFDAECAELVLESLEAEGATVVRGASPLSAVPTGDGRTIVRWRQRGEGGEGEKDVEAEAEFDTVLVATGREPETGMLELGAVGLEVDSEGKLPTVHGTTSVAHVHAIGDMASEAPHGRPELTPVAIRCGELLAQRLCGDAHVAAAAQSPRALAGLAPGAIATAVFAPAEYACVGLSEEAAREQLGDERLEVYHSQSSPLEWSVVEGRASHRCFLKVLLSASECFWVLLLMASHRCFLKVPTAAPRLPTHPTHPHHQPQPNLEPPAPAPTSTPAPPSTSRCSATRPTTSASSASTWLARARPRLCRATRWPCSWA